jgi:hypothetical protein
MALTRDFKETILIPFQRDPKFYNAFSRKASTSCSRATWMPASRSCTSSSRPPWRSAGTSGIADRVVNDTGDVLPLATKAEEGTVMKAADLRATLALADKALRNIAAEEERLSVAYVRRRGDLVNVTTKPRHNRVLHPEALKARESVENARAVHVAFSSLLHVVCSRSRRAIDSYEFAALAEHSPAGATVKAFLEHYTLFGYLHTISLLRVCTVALRLILQKGSAEEFAPTLVDLAKLAGEIAIDEAASRINIDSVENAIKLAQALLGLRDALAAPDEAYDKTGQWLDRMDMTNAALQAWLRSVANIIETMQPRIEQALN